MPLYPKSRNIYKQLPNIVSVSRIFFGTILIIAVFKHNEFLFWFSLILTAISDSLDGFLARKLNAVSNLGKVLDHTVDKALTLTIAYILTLNYGLPILVFYILLLRELITAFIAVYVKISNGEFPSSNPTGKVFGLLSVLTLIAFFYDYKFKFYIMYSAIVFMVISSLANALSLRNNFP